ncbi:TonB-dependent receptor [Caulobacter segnis]
MALSAVGLTPGEDNYKIRLDTEPKNTSKQTMLTGRASLDLGGANLISITSYQDWRFRFLEDLDTLGSPTLLNTADPTSILPNGSTAGGPFHSTNFTQELRLVSSGARKLDYLFALFYADGDSDRSFARGPNAATSWAATAGTKTMAAFTQMTYHVGDKTHLDGGLRFNHEVIEATFVNRTPTATPPANNASCLVTCSGKAKDDHITYKVALRQDLAEHVMAYASFSTGYKGQGFDISTGFTPARAAKPVRPETSKAYELGLKSRVLENRVQLNVTGFLTDFTDFQAQGGVTQPDGTIVPQLSNVGSLRSKGVEVEVSAKPVRALRIDASAAYTDATIREFSNAPCYTNQTLAQGCRPVGTQNFQDLSGKPLANSPKFKYTLAGVYDVDLPSLPFDGFVTAEYTHQSAVMLDLLGTPISRQKAYGVVNASVGVAGRDEAQLPRGAVRQQPLRPALRHLAGLYRLVQRRSRGSAAAAQFQALCRRACADGFLGGLSFPGTSSLDPGLSVAFLRPRRVLPARRSFCGARSRRSDASSSARGHDTGALRDPGACAARGPDRSPYAAGLATGDLLDGPSVPPA